MMETVEIEVRRWREHSDLTNNRPGEISAGLR